MPNERMGPGEAAAVPAVGSVWRSASRLLAVAAIAVAGLLAGCNTAEVSSSSTDSSSTTGGSEPEAQEPEPDAPTGYTDPTGDMPDPALDVVGSTSGRLPDGRYWVLMEFAQPWPSPTQGYQWTIIVRMYADGVGDAVAESVSGFSEEQGGREPEPPIEQQALDGKLLTIFPDPGMDAQLLYNWMVTRAYLDADGAPHSDSDIPTGDRRWAMDNEVDPRA